MWAGPTLEENEQKGKLTSERSESAPACTVKACIRGRRNVGEGGGVRVGGVGERCRKKRETSRL